MGRYIAVDAVDHTPMPGQKKGLAGVQWLFRQIFAAFPDFHQDVRDVIVEGDKVAVRLTWTGTQKGKFMGIAPTGRRVRVSGVDILRIRNGKMVEHWGCEDDLGLMQVAAVLDDIASLPRWWPSVYLDVQILEQGSSEGAGIVARLVTRGWLPYTLRWQLRVTEANPPHGFSIDAWGDLTGRGVWKLTPEGGDVHVVYDWRVRADKPLLRHLSFLFKPLFAANHRWAMARGEESLKREIVRRRATRTEEYQPR
jgi:predicted ester cyclase